MEELFDAPALLPAGVTAHAVAGAEAGAPQALLTGVLLETKLKLLSLLLCLSEYLHLGCSSSAQLLMFKPVGIIYHQIQKPLGQERVVQWTA